MPRVTVIRNRSPDMAASIDVSTISCKQYALLHNIVLTVSLGFVNISSTVLLDSQ